MLLATSLVFFALLQACPAFRFPQQVNLRDVKGFLPGKFKFLSNAPFCCHSPLKCLGPAMGVRRNFSRGGAREGISRGGQHRHFAHIFQFSDDAMQMDVNKTLYPFFAPKMMPHVHGRWKGGWQDQARPGCLNLTFSYYIFSKKRLML